MTCSLWLVCYDGKLLTNNLVYKGALADIRLPQHSNITCGNTHQTHSIIAWQLSTVETRSAPI
jgi:hypothetical protein